jgi:Fic family protein
LKKPFVPEPLPLKNIAWDNLISIIGKANYNLAAYAGTLKAVVSPTILLTPLTFKEAVLSSKIEGTQATLQEVLKFEADPQKETPRYDDIREIINYRKALQESTSLLKQKPMNLNTIKKLHSLLLDSVRGQNKARGDFRREQNWIGKPGSPIEDAYYIPPEPLRILEFLSDWEKYWHYEEQDPIVQLAVIHAQFEIIHPFLDGNGRMGRILIPLFLFEKGLLREPVFYMSEYLESHREEYYARLRSISDSGDWNGWIEFFLKAFMNQAANNIARAEKIIGLYEKMKREMHNVSTKYSIPALDALFTMPIFNTNDFIKFSGIPKASAHRLFSQLAERRIIKPLKEGKPKSPGTYSFPALLKITEGEYSSRG